VFALTATLAKAPLPLPGIFCCSSREFLLDWIDLRRLAEGQKKFQKLSIIRTPQNSVNAAVMSLMMTYRTPYCRCDTGFAWRRAAIEERAAAPAFQIHF
jgi:hypothetical protein